MTRKLNLIVFNNHMGNYVRWVRFILFNTALNNILDIQWWSLSLVKETGVCGENHRPVTSNGQTLSLNVVLSTPRHE